MQILARTENLLIVNICSFSNTGYWFSVKGLTRHFETVRVLLFSTILVILFYFFIYLDPLLLFLEWNCIFVKNYWWDYNPEKQVMF